MFVAETCRTNVYTLVLVTTLLVYDTEELQVTFPDQNK